ncbi:hypothetical protein [Nocardia sp. NPDC051832]|uniref:hypothetical protein n=1 Tax=Nocardia sp. NPDC051832 TaxID=3155673 RepID=UPI00341DA3EF
MSSILGVLREAARVKRTSQLRRRVIEAGTTGLVFKIAGTRPQMANSDNSIDGQLISEILAGRFGQLHRYGLRLQGLCIRGDIDLSNLTWKGALHLKDCYIQGDINMNYAHVTGEVTFDRSSIGYVSARYARIEGTFNIRRAELFEGGFGGAGMVVTGGLNMHHSVFTALPEEKSSYAVRLYRAKVGDLYLYSATVKGGIFANAMTVDRHVRLQGGDFHSRIAMGWEQTGPDYRGAIGLGNCNISGSLYVCTKTLDYFKADGLDLRGTSCGTIYATEEKLASCDANLEGLTYDRLQNISATEMLHVLELAKEFYSQPYVQLASYCSTIGDLTTRRRTLLAMERRITKEQAFFSRSGLARRIYGSLVGYGYSAWLALVWLLIVTALATVVVKFGTPIFSLKPPAGSLPGAGQDLGWSNSLRIVIDNFLPFASLGMKDTWVAAPTNGIQWMTMSAFLSLRLLAWAFAALALLSFTHVVRNPRTL